MEQPSKIENKTTTRRWNWILWWKIYPDELAGQVEQYDSLGITKSARGTAFFFCLLIMIMTFIMAPILHMDKSVYAGSFLYLFLGLFIFKGQRWAIVVMMVLWTFEKGYSLLNPVIENKASATVMPILWWCIYMHAFLIALMVENSRRKHIAQSVGFKEEQERIKRRAIREVLILGLVAVIMAVLIWLINITPKGAVVLWFYSIPLLVIFLGYLVYLAVRFIGWVMKKPKSYEAA